MKLYIVKAVISWVADEPWVNTEQIDVLAADISSALKKATDFLSALKRPIFTKEGEYKQENLDIYAIKEYCTVDVE